MARQLELEKATLLEKKRREQDERRRKQEELDQILLENRRKARIPTRSPYTPPGSPRVYMWIRVTDLLTRGRTWITLHSGEVHAAGQTTSICIHAVQ